MIVAFVNPAGLLLSADKERVPAAAPLLGLLSAAEWIPVTGLDEEGLLDVPAAFTSWQILQHGAVVLTPDGEEDRAWRRLTLETQRERGEALRLAHQAAQHIGWLGQLGTEAELRQRGGQPLMVTLHHPYGLELALEAASREWTAWLDDSPFRGQLRLIQEGGVLTLLPWELNPESAVNYVMDQLGDRLEVTLGLSSAPADAAFLALCDYAVIPGGSALLASPNAEVGDGEA